MALEQVRIALDWTANTTHAALLCAESFGFNKDEGLAVSFVEPTTEHAPATPIEGLLNGAVEIAISPCDHVLKEHMGSDRVVCVATLTAVDISAVCVLEESKIKSPSDLAGARYGSCGYPLEVACLQGMIRESDPESKAEVVEVCPAVRPHTEQLLLEGEVDCAWMYRTWECVRAKRAGIKLREFRPADHGVPFGYMNCVVVTRERLSTAAGEELIRKLLRAASKGAAWAESNTRRAAQELSRMVSSGAVSARCGLDDEETCTQSLAMLTELGALGGKQGWGSMDVVRWGMFVAWAFSPQTVRALGKLPRGPDSLNLSALYTNELLPCASEGGEGAGEGETGKKPRTGGAAEEACP